MAVYNLDQHMNSLKLIIIPSDGETSIELINMGFEKIPAVGQLLYQYVSPMELGDVFNHLSKNLTEISLARSRFLLTRSPLDSGNILLEFLQAQPLKTVTGLVKYAWFFPILLKQRLFFKYQPIFNLESGQVIAYECLARALGDRGQPLNGQQLIDAAISTRLSCEFDDLARTTCIESIANTQANQTFFINVLPNALIRDPNSLEQNLEQLLELGLQPKQIVFELTEVEKITYPGELPLLIKKMRELGFGIAIDDLWGSGSIDHYFFEFHPDIIKLDRRVVNGCAQHSIKQTLIKSLLYSAHELGIFVIAEGLENVEDIEFCRTLGVDFGQGFGLAVPELTLQRKHLNLMSFATVKAS